MLRAIADAHASGETGRLADRIWMLTLQLTSGDLAPKHKCRDFLKTFCGVYLDRNLCDAARQLLEGLTPTELGRLRSQAVQDEYLHYRSSSGRAWYTPRQVKNPPCDDLSLRLFEAYCALKEAGCPTASAFLARRLGWSSNRVETRLKPLKKGPCPSWPGS